MIAIPDHSQQIDDNLADETLRSSPPAEANADGTTLSPELARLADQIRRQHEDLRGEVANIYSLMVDAVDRKIQLGLLLGQAKELCPRGQWLPFLASVDVNPRMAAECMQFVAQRSDRGSKSARQCAFDGVGGPQAARRPGSPGPPGFPVWDRSARGARGSGEQPRDGRRAADPQQ